MNFSFGDIARRRLILLAGLAALSAPASAERLTAAQAPAAGGTTATALTIAGDVTQTRAVSPADLKAMPRTTVSVDEKGRQVRYEGVLVGELLARAGAPPGRDLSGKALGTYVRASAKDGYQVVFSLPRAGSRAHDERRHRG